MKNIYGFWFLFYICETLPSCIFQEKAASNWMSIWNETNFDRVYITTNKTIQILKSTKSKLNLKEIIQKVKQLFEKKTAQKTRT